MIARSLVSLITVGCLLTSVVNSEPSNLLLDSQFKIRSLLSDKGSSLSTNQTSSGAGDIFSNIESCFGKPELQEIRSEELKKLVDEDQDERRMLDTTSVEQWTKLLENDLMRRKRVGEIFGEGCIKKPEDYAAASLIYQHGDIPDHYFQAFIWAKRAFELGDEKQKHLIALTIDRYLVSIGKKQLFATQFYSPSIGACYCLEQVETSFPESLRKEYVGYTLQDALDSILPMFNTGKDCPKAECPMELQPSPKGTVPGFW